MLLAALAALMGSFLAYHLWLVRCGMTTYETYKWRDVRLAGGRPLWCALEGPRWPHMPCPLRTLSCLS